MFRKSAYGKNIDEGQFTTNGQKLLSEDPSFSKGYAIFVGDRISLAHDSIVHGLA